jgi:hypothetical protein
VAEALELVQTFAALELVRPESQKRIAVLVQVAVSNSPEAQKRTVAARKLALVVALVP